MKENISATAFGLSLFMLLTVLGSFAASAQESDQYRIENSVILQDIPAEQISEVSTQVDQRRNSRLSKDGFSVLIGETPLRVRIPDTNLEYKDGPDGWGNVTESHVKIIYTKEGGYALFLGGRSTSYTSNVFNATGCDRVVKCFTTYARPWLDKDVYGFGYTLAGEGAAADFVDRRYFRPFSILTAMDPIGAFVAEGRGREQELTFITRLHEARPEQGTFTKPIIITVLHDW